MKGSNFIVLTEKEIQLLELFLSNKAAISKKYFIFSMELFYECGYPYC